MINTTAFLTLAVIAFFLFSSTIYKAYILTLANPVPSGDDPAVHVYMALRVAEDPLSIFRLRVYNYTTIPLQYPNLIHVSMALLYIVTYNVLYLIEFVKIFDFITVLIGITLYSYIIYELAKPLDLRQRAELTLAYVALASLLSPGVLHTLSDGSLMELFAVLILLPLVVILLIKERYLAAGIALGLSSLSTFGFIQTTAAATPWIFSLIIKRPKAVLQILAGTAAGGNIFLARDTYKLTVYALSILSKPSLTEGNLSPAIFPLGALATYGIANIFLVSLSIYATTLLCCWRQYSQQMLLAATIWTTHDSLIVILPGVLHYPQDALWRFIRVNLYLASITITLSTYVAVRGLAQRRRQIDVEGLALLGAILLTFLLLVHLLHFFTAPTGKLLRINDTELQAYLAIRDWLLEHGSQNSTILAISQVSTWAAAILTIPQKGINVFLVATPDIYSTYSPDDPNRAVGLKFYEALVNQDINTLKKYNVQFILIEKPKEGQWYYENIKNFAEYLWKENLTRIATIIYYQEYIKLWQLKDS